MIKRPITLESPYFGRPKKTNISEPAKLARKIAKMKAGHGDVINVTDASGARFDIVDLGRGLQFHYVGGGK